MIHPVKQVPSPSRVLTIFQNQNRPSKKPILVAATPPSLSLSVLLSLLLVRLFLALRRLLVALPLSLLPSRELVELALGPDQIPPWVPDSEDEKGYHDGETIEGVGICLVEGDWIARRNSAGELGHTKDDANLSGVSKTSQTSGRERKHHLR